MICRNCTHPLPAGSSFCPFCGTKQYLSEFCPRCGAKLVSGALFCSKCGNDISQNNTDVEEAIVHSGNAGEPFYKKWIAAHQQLAENKHITWISEFKDNYAVAIDDRASGRELRPFLVRGEEVAELVCYMSWTGANLANGVLEPQGDCFRNGSRFLSFILFRSNSMVSADEFRRILRAFTGISQPFATSGVTLLISRDSRILFSAQYQENITGIADIFPMRIIGGKYCLQTMPEEYNRMTNRVRYNAVSDDITVGSQKVVDCDNGISVLDNVFVPKYDGDPSEYFVEYYYYSDRIIDILRSRYEMDRQRCIFNRKTGKLYLPERTVRYKTVRINGEKGRDRYLLLKISDIYAADGASGKNEAGIYELIDDNDRIVISLGKNNLRFTPQIMGSGNRCYLNMPCPMPTESSRSGESRPSDLFCYEKDTDGGYTQTGHLRLDKGGGFADGIVHFHNADKTESCGGVFVVNGKTYISILQERSGFSDDHDKCLLLDEQLGEICSFNYKLNYGDQTPYGLHVFDSVICSLSSEEDEFGDEKAVLKNTATNEIMFSAEPSQLISGATAEFGKSRIRAKYEFGSYRCGNSICFLIGKQNRGLGIMDFHGKTVIPAERDNYFIVSGAALGLIGENNRYARLPADTFLIVLGSFDSNRYRVCGPDGNTVFEGNMADLISRFS